MRKKNKIEPFQTPLGNFVTNCPEWSGYVQRARVCVLGVDADSSIGLICERNPFAYAALCLAALAESRAVVLGNPHWGAHEWNALRAQFSASSNCPLVRLRLEDEPSVGSEQGFADVFPCDVNTGLDSSSICLPESLQGSVAIATGGSGGGLKFCVHTLSTLTESVMATQRYFALDTLNSVCCLPLYHVSGYMQLVRAALTGGRIALVSTQEWQEVEIPESESWQISLVPTLLRRAAKQSHTLECLRAFSHVFVGGAQVDGAWLQQLSAEGVRLCPVYGMTETAAMVVATRPEDLSRWGVLGEALPHTRVAIEQGQIVLSCQSLMRGYLHELLSGIRPINHNRWATGDAGSLDPDGRLAVLGRLDHAINTGGEKVYPHEVEQVLRTHPALDEVCVFGVADADWGTRVVCAYTSRSDENVEVECLKTWLRSRLSPWKVPKQWLSLPALPINDRGKIDLVALRKIAAECEV